MKNPGFILIQKDYVVVKELAVFFNHGIFQHAIVLEPNHYLMISRERFNHIIDTAKANGCDIYDYTICDW